ncbi:MAG: hypothetical protein DMG32_21275 [Acidobacteria bacterium]|nr:MAG: hypothetical protein DMG32_21275 [Acidobacteriota bacterium]
MARHAFAVHAPWISRGRRCIVFEQFVKCPFHLARYRNGPYAEERSRSVSKPFADGAYVRQRLNLVVNGKAHERNAKASNRT